MVAMIDFTTARKRMVDNQLLTSGVTDPRILAAMGQVPRELFVPPRSRPTAYLDRQVPLSVAGRYLPAPVPFARLVQLAEILEADRVLDIGCGPAWSTAVLSRLARGVDGQVTGQVTGLEWDATLMAAARSNLNGLGMAAARLVLAGMDRPPPVGGGYDAIVVEGMLDEVPASVLAALAPGGRLVVVLPRQGVGVAHLFVRTGDSVTSRAVFDASMPRLTPEKPPVFEF